MQPILKCIMQKVINMKGIYRFSSYSIVVPLDSEPENVFMMHGYTGAIDVLSKEIAEYLQNHESFNKEELPCSETTAAALEKRGYITLWSKEEEVEYAKRLANALYRKENILNNNFTIVVTYDCNFRCPYCFEKGIKKDTTTFTKEMTDKLYKTILEIAPEKELRNNTIVLYGGEPLLKENKAAVTYLVEKGKELGFKFSAITNGYDLDYYEELLGPDSICSVQISVDGLPERHNQQRRHKLGIPTFEKIIQNIGIALEHSVKVSIRINTNKENINDLEKLQQLFFDLHYIDNPLFRINSALIQDFDSEKVSPNNFKTKEYLKRTSYFEHIKACNDFGLRRKIITAIKLNIPLSLHAASCTSQTGSLVFDPYEHIYPCLEVVGQDKHCIGSYQSETIDWHHDNLLKWKKSPLKRDDCIRCKFAFICSGGCPVYRFKNENRCTHIESFIHEIINAAYVSFK